MKRISVPLQFLALASLMLVGGAALTKEKPPQEWDGLKLVKLKGMDVAYARPGADFTVYTKIMIDPIEVAFAKNWDAKSNYNNQKIPASKLEEIKTELGKLAEETFAEEFSKKGGAQIVTTPG